MGANILPRRPGALHPTSLHTVQVTQAGFVHFGLLQSLHKSFRPLQAALWMSLSEKALFGNVPPHILQGSGRQATHRKVEYSSFVFGSRLGRVGISTFPHRPGVLHPTSRHTVQVSQAGLVHLGLLQSLHKSFRPLQAAWWMSLSEKALFGFAFPHILQGSG